MISPSVAALASKYATSSVGGSSVGGMSLQEQPSAGESSRPLPYWHARQQRALGAALQPGLHLLLLLLLLRWHLQPHYAALLTLCWRCLHGLQSCALCSVHCCYTHQKWPCFSCTMLSLLLPQVALAQVTNQGGHHAETSTCRMPCLMQTAQIYRSLAVLQQHP
jgi:hypothetical protein